MDRQDIQDIVSRWQRRFDRSLPEAIYVYGRRAVKAAGFSPAELEEAGISVEDAKAVGLKVDAQRMNSLGANVESLREFLKRVE
ncbi:MAG TPA: ribosomal protein L13e [Terriglobales bacterium]|nr:ribosomal protein L13e [Terriglobales bacterium]